VRVTIREEAALRNWTHLFARYVADRESVELRSLVVEKPDGRKVTLDSSSLRDLPTPDPAPSMRRRSATIASSR
jgi:hypothetical protein